MDDDDHIQIGVTRGQARDILMCLATLSIAVDETKKVKMEQEKVERLGRARDLAARWDEVFARRDELRRMEADLCRPPK